MKEVNLALTRMADSAGDVTKGMDKMEIDTVDAVSPAKQDTDLPVDPPLRLRLRSNKNAILLGKVPCMTSLTSRCEC